MHPFFHMWTLYRPFLTSLGRLNLSLLIPCLSLYIFPTPSKNVLDPPWPYATSPSSNDTSFQISFLTTQA